MRGLQVVLDGAVICPTAVYLSYFIVGGLLCLAGALLLMRRHPEAVNSVPRPRRPLLVTPSLALGRSHVKEDLP